MRDSNERRRLSHAWRGVKSFLETQTPEGGASGVSKIAAGSSGKDYVYAKNTLPNR